MDAGGPGTRAPSTSESPIVGYSDGWLADALEILTAQLSHVPGTRFERLDLRTEPMPDGPFDLVVSAWALEHLPEPSPVVAAARARLRPGGWLVLFFELDGHSVGSWPLRRLWRFFGAPWFQSTTRGTGQGSSRSAASPVSVPMSPSRCSPPRQRRPARRIARLLRAIGD